MTPLPVPVPPRLADAIGYTGDARLIAVYWSPCGDAPVIDDGRSSRTGHPWGWLAWARHGIVAPSLMGTDIGSSDRDGTQSIVFDLAARTASLASRHDARGAARRQWPAADAAELTADELGGAVERLHRATLDRTLPTMGELMEQMRRHAKVVAGMVEWLDRHA